MRPDRGLCGRLAFSGLDLYPFPFRDLGFPVIALGLLVPLRVGWADRALLSRRPQSDRSGRWSGRVAARMRWIEVLIVDFGVLLGHCHLLPWYDKGGQHTEHRIPAGLEHPPLRGCSFAIPMALRCAARGLTPTGRRVRAYQRAVLMETAFDLFGECVNIWEGNLSRPRDVWR